jgi:hypothetical protein
MRSHSENTARGGEAKGVSAITSKVAGVGPLRRPLFIVAVAAALAAFWMLRYDMQKVSQGPVAYILDRWTGEVSFCNPNDCRKLR